MSLRKVYLGKNIAHLRKKAKWKQKDLAKVIDVSYFQVGSYEREQNEPHIQTLIKISMAFNKTVDELILTDLTKL